MADIREQTLLDQMDAAKLAVSRNNPLRSRIRMGLRRLVVRTSFPPLTQLYSAIYDLHLRYAVRVLRRLPGVHSIYLTGGLSSGEICPGISDIDLAVNGQWNEEEQRNVARAMRRLSAISPLFDPQLGSSVHTLDSLIELYRTDYFFQVRFNLGRTAWKRMYGEDLFALLPPADERRAAGSYYFEVRLWWGQFARSAFGSGLTATDELFRNSIAYKTVAAIQKMDLFFRGKPAGGSRKAVIENLIDETSDPSDRAFLQRLQRSADHRHLRFDGDIQEETLRYLLSLIERIHQRLGQAPAFEPAATVMHVDGAADELMVISQSRAHIDALVGIVKTGWEGYRAAYLVPSLSFFYPDDLLLLIEVDPSRPPTVKQIRELCRLHLHDTSASTQRVALFLLMPEGAYQLDILSATELWHHTLCPAANPEVFTLLARSQFILDGTFMGRATSPQWTRFAHDQLTEEITIRRAAFGNPTASAAGLGSLELLRNLWRQVQLEIMVRSEKSGQIVVPMTVPAMLRALRSWGLPEDSVFGRLADAYRAEIAGAPVNVAAMLPEVMSMLALFQ